MNILKYKSDAEWLSIQSSNSLDTYSICGVANYCEFDSGQEGRNNEWMNQQINQL